MSIVSNNFIFVCLRRYKKEKKEEKSIELTQSKGSIDIFFLLLLFFLSYHPLITHTNFVIDQYCMH
jgi:biopolymer transport protein ExbD